MKEFESELKWRQILDLDDYIEIDGDNAYLFHYTLHGNGWIDTTDENQKELTINDWQLQHPNIKLIDKRDGREFKH